MASTSYGTIEYGELTDENRLYYEMNLLERAIPNFIHLWFGMEGSVRVPAMLPENKGHQIQWNKFTALSAVTTALTEGVTPDPQDISTTTVTGTVYEYGAYIRYTKTMAELGIHKIAQEASDLLGEQAGDSLDQLIRNTLVAETGNVLYCNNRGATASILSTDYLNFNEVMEAVTTLRTNKSVGPLAGGKFPGLLHPYAVYDLYNDAVFQAILSYAKERGDGNPWISGHIGDAFGVSFYESPNAYVNADAGDSSTDVYSTMFLGKGGFGTGGLAAYMPQVIREQQDKSNHTFEKVRPLRLIDKPFGSTGSADPFNRLASIAWYTTFVVKVLNANFYSRVEHATTLGS